MLPALDQYVHDGGLGREWLFSIEEGGIRLDGERLV